MYEKCYEIKLLNFIRPRNVADALSLKFHGTKFENGMMLPTYLSFCALTIEDLCTAFVLVRSHLSGGNLMGGFAYSN